MSPAIHRERGYVFYFRMYDLLHEPPHVHVGKGSDTGGASDAKIWLDPIAVARAGRFGTQELNRMLRIVEKRRKQFLEEWNHYAQRGR